MENIGSVKKPGKEKILKHQTFGIKSCRSWELKVVDMKSGGSSRLQKWEKF